ncbi:hypothetical protein BMETH_644_1 [methanotrophic bacterial endosymbiont of Bathymodiolus sp.]|nr:hypothetical protein BMETH_644_1 [methanotrophic bacterial endosymbiont of Bathymodiolus sp.]
MCRPTCTTYISPKVAPSAGFFSHSATSFPKVLVQRPNNAQVPL